MDEQEYTITEPRKSDETDSHLLIQSPTTQDEQRGPHDRRQTSQRGTICEKSRCYTSQRADHRETGVIPDSGLTIEKQVNAISKSCFNHIRNIGQVK